MRWEARIENKKMLIAAAAERKVFHAISYDTKNALS